MRFWQHLNINAPIKNKIYDAFPICSKFQYSLTICRMGIMGIYNLYDKAASLACHCANLHLCQCKNDLNVSSKSILNCCNFFIHIKVVNWIPGVWFDLFRQCSPGSCPWEVFNSSHISPFCFSIFHALGSSSYQCISVTVPPGYYYYFFNAQPIADLCTSQWFQALVYFLFYFLSNDKLKNLIEYENILRICR